MFDTNVWIALAFTAHPLHPAARAALVAAAANPRALFCRATQQSVLRLLTTSKVVQLLGIATPTNQQALVVLDGFLALPSVGFIDEPVNVFARWRALADLPPASPKRWMDSYLAAFAIEAGLMFVTADKDFTAFPGLNLTLLSRANPNGPRPMPPATGGTP